MFLIYKDGEIIERAETLRYVLRQENGVAVIATQENYNAVYSPATDKTYPIGVFFVEEEDETVALRAENKLLKEQVSALSTQADFHEECIVEMANIVYA
jgi:hypothetical protein